MGSVSPDSGVLGEPAQVEVGHTAWCRRCWWPSLGCVTGGCWPGLKIEAQLSFLTKRACSAVIGTACVGTESHTASALSGAFAAVGLETEINSGASAATAQQNRRDKCSTPLEPCSQRQPQDVWARWPSSCWCNCGSLGSCHVLIQQIKPLIKGKRLPWWKAKQGNLIITTILSAYRGGSALDLNLSSDALIPSCNGTLVFWTLTESPLKPVAGSDSQ